MQDPEYSFLVVWQLYGSIVSRIDIGR